MMHPVHVQDANASGRPGRLLAHLANTIRALSADSSAFCPDGGLHAIQDW